MDEFTKLKVRVIQQDLQVGSKVAPITSRIEVSADFEFSLWSDISAESSEFIEQFNQLEKYKILKLNIFTLFDQSTLAAGMIDQQKVAFAKSIIYNLHEIKRKEENWRLSKTVEVANIESKV